MNLVLVDIPVTAWFALATALLGLAASAIGFLQWRKDQQGKQIDRLWSRVDKLDADKEGLEGRVGALRSEVASLRWELRAREGDVAKLQARIQELETEIAHCGDVQKHKSLQARLNSPPHINDEDDTQAGY